MRIGAAIFASVLATPAVAMFFDERPKLGSITFTQGLDVSRDAWVVILAFSATLLAAGMIVGFAMWQRRDAGAHRRPVAPPTQWRAQQAQSNSPSMPKLAQRGWVGALLWSVASFTVVAITAQAAVIAVAMALGHRPPVTMSPAVLIAAAASAVYAWRRTRRASTS